jgi:hypothetical protein
MVQKYGSIDVDGIRIKMDVIKQESRERVQTYFGRLDKMFRKGQIPDVEQRRRFLARLRPEIRKMCVLRVVADIEELVAAAIEVERVLGELGETPFEPLKEEQEEEMTGMSMKNPITALINLLQENMSNPISSFPPALLIECQVCEGRDHIARTCPRLNTPWPKCARCGGPHRTESCGVRYPFYSDLGCAEDRYQRKRHEKGSRLGAANLMETMPSDGAAVTTVKERITGRQPVDELAGETNAATGVKRQYAATPYEEPRAELSDTKKEHVDAAEDKISVEVVETTKEIDNILELNEEATTIQQDQAPLAVKETNKQFLKAADDQIAAELVQDEEKTAALVAEDIIVEVEIDAEKEEPFTPILLSSADDDDLVNQGTMMSCKDEQQTQITQSRMVDSIPLTVGRNAYGQDPCVQKFSISISKQLANVEAQILPLPRLKYHDRSWEECILSIGHENLMNIRMRHWTCINFSQCAIAGIAPRLCNDLIEMCQTSGMVFEMNPVLTIQCAKPKCCDNEEIEEASNVADEHEKRPRLITISEHIHSATSESKKIAAGPEAALSDSKMDADGTTGTPLEGLGVCKAMHDSTLITLAISINEVSVKQEAEACYKERPINFRMKQADASDPWMKEHYWIYFIQVANGNMWARTCRGLQIHHDAPD